MAQLTRLDEGDLRQIVAPLTLESWQALPAAGTVNSNYRARASGRELFVRVNEGKLQADVRAEAELVRQFAAQGVPVVEPLGVVSHGEKWVTIFPFVGARESRALDDVAAAGEALGRIHAARILEAPRNHYSLDELERRLATFSGDARFFEVVPDLARELLAARTRERGPLGLIHQDLFPDNLLVGEKGELVAVLDFEQATLGPLVYDLAVTLNAFCWDGERMVDDAVERLIGAYESYVGMIDRAPLAAECRLAAARFTITRITDVFLPDGVDADLRRRKDWRDYARRLAFFVDC